MAIQLHCILFQIANSYPMLLLPAADFFLFFFCGLCNEPSLFWWLLIIVQSPKYISANPIIILYL